MKTRILGIDAMRSMAILLAMGSHVYSETGVGRYLTPEVSIPLRVLMQTATPIFVLLLGTMLELVYYPRWISGQKALVTSRLFKRALQCWILYALSIFCLFLVDDGYSLKFSISCLLFMGNSPYTEILKFYAFILALAPLLLWVRERVELWPLVAFALAYQLAWPLLHDLPDVRTDLGFPRQVARIVKFLTGFGSSHLAGPSVLHGLTLVIGGLCLGRFIAAGRRGPTDEERAAAFGRRISLALLPLVAMSVTALLTAPDWVFRGLSNMSLRMNSHVIYFAAGALAALCLTLAFIWIVDVRAPGRASMWRGLSFFGRTSMFTFAWGNMLLYLVDHRPTTEVGAFGMAALLLATICLMSLLFDLIMRHSDSARTLLAVVNRPLDRLTGLSLAK
ncbi:OpgC domain-containing protein [Falsirhodobacter sp. 20TX0035]|uniref:OpgC domain-containing protein n=1 Tax=Falsirhodobacter sp. 20TX0035 TaxID=3022019 RepID=UPI002330E75F|nr:OpgC domain-containing protein [Falsirhodobacter sp. 20TX0035]MDB6454792.1 OpgC domain-containing protein [Falsirhodobacter sp. 20TX0035]